MPRSFMERHANATAVLLAGDGRGLVSPHARSASGFPMVLWAVLTAVILTQ